MGQCPMMEAHKLCRYFFHASDDRRVSADHTEPDSEEDEEMKVEEQQPSLEQDGSLRIPTTAKGIEAKVQPAEDVDPALVDWLRVDAGHIPTDDSETEPESDVDSLNDDVGKDVDEWTEVHASGSETLETFQTLVSLACPPFQRVVHIT